MFPVTGSKCFRCTNLFKFQKDLMRLMLLSYQLYVTQKRKKQKTSHLLKVCLDSSLSTRCFGSYTINRQQEERSYKNEATGTVSISPWGIHPNSHSPLPSILAQTPGKKISSVSSHIQYFFLPPVHCLLHMLVVH